MADRPGNGSISTRPDDVAGRRRAATTTRRRSAEGRAPGRGLGNSLILAVLVAGLVVAGWFIAEQHQRLQAGNQALEQASARIAVLEDRLRVTDEALTETGEATSEQINFWESEIRKLWAVSNERNKKWIEDNQRSIKSIQQSITRLQSTAQDIQGTLGRHETAFERQQQVVDELTNVQMQLEQVVRSQRDLVDRVNTAQQSVARLQSGLASRVEENAEAVAAIDAYRLQLNSRLADIERQLANLSASASL